MGYDLESFTQHVHDAYAHLYDRARLQNHPLGPALFGSSYSGPEQLHRLLLSAIEWLRPLGVAAATAEWRRYRALQLRYAEGATPEQIARELIISRRQARRDHLDALDELARLLWHRRAPGPPRSGDRGLPAAPRAQPPADGLEAELSKLTERSPAEPSFLPDLIAGVIATISPLARSQRVEIIPEIPGPLPPTTVGRTILRQLLLGVLSSAIVAHPGARLSVKTEAAAGVIAVLLALDADPAGSSPVVSDAAREVAARLGRSQGVEVMPGPEHERTVSLRIAIPADPARTLLLIDDNPDIALLFRRFLADTGFNLVQARSAERAVRLARELRPDLIFLDVLLPSQDGWEILQSLRSDPETRSRRVVVCTVLPDHALAWSLGITDFLPKPVTRPALLSLLERLLPGVGNPPVPGRRESSAESRSPEAHRSG